MLAQHAHEMDWAGVMRSLADYSSASLMLAGILTACSYAVYSCFDLLARRYTLLLMSTGSVMGVTFISHALGLSLGVAGVALRFRLYGAFGIDSPTVARIWGLSVVTNWLGFLLLAGALFAVKGIDVSPAATENLAIGATALQGLGFAFLVATMVYLFVCATRSSRPFHVFGKPLQVPSLPLATMQLALSMANWLLIAGVLFVLLHQKIDYPTVLGVLLISSLALSIVDVPGGLGVTEAVFLALLGSRMPLAELLAALVVYRAVFYLAPLVPAMLGYMAIEFRRRPRPA